MQKSSWRTVFVLMAVILFTAGVGSGVAGIWDDLPVDQYYGAESNPTGDSIGGGAGYSRILLDGDYRVSTAEELLTALSKAKAGEVVYVVPDAEINLTGMRNILIPPGVTLAGNRGNEGSPGPLIYTDEKDTAALFITRGGDVRITGLRLRGPDGETGTDRDAEPYSGAVNALQSPRLEVDNCEIYNWAVQGIGVRDESNDAYIHHNYFHHIQRTGLGYPVVVSASTALIEANLFDYYRHAIASGGSYGSGYEARYNIMTANATSHAIDMHGGSDYCPSRASCSEEEWFIAGSQVHVHHNTLYVTSQRGIRVRGVPTEGSRVHNNWFLNPAVSMSYDHRYYSGGNVHVFNNVFGPQKQLVEVQVTPDPFIRRVGSDGGIVALSAQESHRFGFISPKQTDGITAYSGVLPIEVRVDLADLQPVAHIRITLDDQIIYDKPYAPMPGELQLNTLDYEDGNHWMKLTAVMPGGDEITQTVTVNFRNWWTKYDPFTPPVLTGWFAGMDMSVTSSTSAGWRYAADAAEEFFADADRRVRIADTTEYLVWETPQLRLISLTVYGKAATLLNSVQLFVSQDQETWQPVAFEESVEDGPSEWKRFTLHAETVGMDADWCKVVVTAGSGMDIQLGRAMFKGLL
ncbi:MAG: hypothetical protein ACOX44_09705 [Limnochordia bacterium]|jgi:hypothetical protein